MAVGQQRITLCVRLRLWRASKGLFLSLPGDMLRLCVVGEQCEVLRVTKRSSVWLEGPQEDTWVNCKSLAAPSHNTASLEAWRLLPKKNHLQHICRRQINTSLRCSVKAVCTRVSLVRRYPSVSSFETLNVYGNLTAGSQLKCFHMMLYDIQSLYFVNNFTLISWEMVDHLQQCIFESSVRNMIGEETNKNSRNIILLLSL